MAKARTHPYADPADANPRPEPKEVDVSWVDDDAPSGWKISASPGAGPRWATKEDGTAPRRGRRALVREDGGLAQDVLEGGTPFEVPQDGRLFVHVRLEAQWSVRKPPEAPVGWGMPQLMLLTKDSAGQTDWRDVPTVFIASGTRRWHREEAVFALPPQAAHK